MIRHAWGAISGGRFFTGWTLAASGVVAVVLLSPYAGLSGIGPHLAAIAASFVAWAILVVAALPAAAMERRIATPGGRGALVIAVLAGASITRPFLNDAVAWMLFDHVSTDGWSQRIATNALTWFTLLPLVAAVASWYAQSRDASERLRAAVSVFDDLGGQVDRYRVANAELLTETIAHLRGRRDALLAGHIDFDGVRAFADDVRADSHRLDARLRERIEGRDRPPAAAARVAPARATVLARISRSSAPLVAAVYFIASAPYTSIVGGWLLVLVAAAYLAISALCAGPGAKRVARGRTAAAHGAIVLAVWVCSGAGMAAMAAAVTQVDRILLLMPAVALPGLAAIVGLAGDALSRAREDSRILTEKLADASEGAAARTARARAPLSRAVRLLHDRVQSRCVIFAAKADERVPTTEEVAEFRRQTDAAFAGILDPGAEASDADGQEGLDGLLAAWAGVLDVEVSVDGGAAAALQSPPVTAQVVAVVGEGFLNAVKHSATRAMALAVRTAADECGLVVAVTSRGVLGTGPAGIGLAPFGDRARLRQVGEDVVLEVWIPLHGSVWNGSAPESFAARSVG